MEDIIDSICELARKKDQDNFKNKKLNAESEA